MRDPDISSPFQFSTSCPLCDEALIAEGDTSDVIVERKVRHLRNDHTFKEVQKFYYAEAIAKEDSK